jgi:hypothetical protein
VVHVQWFRWPELGAKRKLVLARWYLTGWSSYSGLVPSSSSGQHLVYCGLEVAWAASTGQLIGQQAGGSVQPRTHRV